MDARQRFLACLAGEQTDRMPLLPIMYDGYYARASGCQQWEFDYAPLEQQVGMQVAVRKAHPLADALKVWAGRNRGPVPNVKLEREGGRAYAVHTDTGQREEIDTTPGVSRSNPKGAVSAQIAAQPAVESYADVDRIMVEPPRAEELLATPTYQALRELCEALGEDTFVTCNNGSFFPGIVEHLGGMPWGLTRTLENPDLVLAVAERVVQMHIAHIQASAICGVDAVFVACFYEGADILSPQTWRKLAKPGHAKIIQAAHECGIKHFTWFLGNTLPMARDWVELGTDLLITEQPRTGYHCDPAALRMAAGADLNIAGWLWEEDLIRGDRAAIRRTIEEQMQGAGANGRFVMTSASLNWDVAPAHVQMFLEEAAEAGLHV